MFQREITVRYSSEGGPQPCPLKWLDNFAMRNFTNDVMFDDTLPVGDGIMKIGSRVSLDRLKTAMEDWFRKKSYLPQESTLIIAEKAAANASALERPLGEQKQ